MIPDDDFTITEGMTIDDDNVDDNGDNDNTIPESDERADGDDGNVDDDGDFDDDDDVDNNIPHRKLRILKSRVLNELPGMDQN